MSLQYRCPECGSSLERKESCYQCKAFADHRYPIVDGIPRFVDPEDHRNNFEWQWKKWDSILSDRRSSNTKKKRLIRERTGWSREDLCDCQVLEIGCGGGDDTEALLSYPLKSLHSFDLTGAVERADRYLDDERLELFQASLYQLPFPPESFDVVFCHRVIQHTPDPEKALRKSLRMIRPGGTGFVHCYRKNWFYLMHWKYKLRWLTKRLPPNIVYRLIHWNAKWLYRLCELMDPNRLLKLLRHNFVPFQYYEEYGTLDRDKLIELGELVTFDALTPQYDNPMRESRFLSIIEDENCRVIRNPSDWSLPLMATVRKRG